MMWPHCRGTVVVCVSNECALKMKTFKIFGEMC